MIQNENKSMRWKLNIIAAFREIAIFANYPIIAVMD